MEKINSNASNFATVVCKGNVGKTVELPNGQKLEIIAYFVSNKDRKGNIEKGRQTKIDCKIDGVYFEDLSTEEIKQKYCLERAIKPHAPKQKTTFATVWGQAQGLANNASTAELQEAVKHLQHILHAREEAERVKAEQERKKQEALSKLSAEERALLGL